jgi:hypothetical protein
MNLKSFPSLDRGASSTRAHPHAMGQHKLINRSIVASVLTLAAATISQPAQAVTSLVFNTVDTAAGRTTGYQASGPIPLSANGPMTTSNTVYYKDVNAALGIDAKITATVTGANYSFVDHEINYTSAGSSNGDAAFDYKANAAGVGVMTYQIDFYQSTGGIHDYLTSATPFDFNLLVYDIDGSATQTEALRVFKSGGASGLDSYQIGNSGASSLSVTNNTTNYFFAGRGANVSELSVNGDVLLGFTQSSSATLQFEATTLATSAFPDYVFSGIDGDSSILANTTGTFATKVTAQKIPEPFTIIGSLVGGAAALRMRKKLKATSK